MGRAVRKSLICGRCAGGSCCWSLTLTLLSQASASPAEPLPHRLMAVRIAGSEQVTGFRLTFDRRPDLSLMMLRRALSVSSLTCPRRPSKCRRRMWRRRDSSSRSAMARWIATGRAWSSACADRSRSPARPIPRQTTAGPSSRSTWRWPRAKRSKPLFASGDRAVEAIAVSTPKEDRLGGRTGAERPFTVVVDAGHGGIDSGARGRHGVTEKTITLAFARELKDQLQAKGDIRVVLTRDDDSFISLKERVRIGRQSGAALFVSDPRRFGFAALCARRHSLYDLEAGVGRHGRASGRFGKCGRRGRRLSICRRKAMR